MKHRLEQRAVYAATIVAILAATAGWAVAFAWTTIDVQGGANNTYIAAGNTIYGVTGSSAQQIFTANVGSGTCGITGTGGALLVINAPGSATATCAADEFEEEVNFTSSASLAAGTYTDQFVVAAEFNTPGTFTANSYSAICTLTVSGPCEVTIVIDSGVAASSGAIPDVTGIQITITGN